MSVFVISVNGTRLMPTSERKARILLREHKASVFCKVPFTIQLSYESGTTTQPCTVGVDTGSQNIGIAIVSEDKVIHKSEYALRKTMEKRKLIETRKQYRRGRRYRKTRYRHAKWKYHTKRAYDTKKKKWVKQSNVATSNRQEGWLPPSLQSKLNAHFFWINRYLNLLPNGTKLNIEVGRFDMARMQNPTIHGEQYQHGDMEDYENVRAFIFDRDGYTCQCCGAKAGTKRKDGTTVKLIAHHIDMRHEGSTDNPKRMITVCDKCHTDDAHNPGGILYQWMLEGKRTKQGLRDASFMNIVRKRMFERYPNALFTYGNITKVKREELSLSKTHANDAVAIVTCGTDIVSVEDHEQTYHVQQCRKKKRSLHEATPRKGRKKPNRTAKRNAKNTKQVGKYKLFDKVKIGNQVGWITGFTGGAAYVKNKSGEYIKTSKSYNQVSLSNIAMQCRNNTWLVGPITSLGRGS